jgi:hypothetical protein
VPFFYGDKFPSYRNWSHRDSTSGQMFQSFNLLKISLRSQGISMTTGADRCTRSRIVSNIHTHKYNFNFICKISFLLSSEKNILPTVRTVLITSHFITYALRSYVRCSLSTDSCRLLRLFSIERYRYRLTFCQEQLREPISQQNVGPLPNSDRNTKQEWQPLSGSAWFVLNALM